MAYIIETNLREKFEPNAFFEDPPPGWKEFWRPTPGIAFPAVDAKSGYPIAPELVPSKVVMKKKWSRLPNFFSIQGSYGISTAFKMLVEEIEPGVHQFFPLQIRRSDGGPVEGEYWLFVICNLVDTAIDPERSTVYVSEPSPGSPYWSYGLKSGSVIVVKWAKIQGLHAWVDRRHRRTFFSDALVNAIDARKLAGFEDRQRVDESDAE